MSRRSSTSGAPMNDELTRIEDQLRRALKGGAWHGPAVLELLDGGAWHGPAVLELLDGVTAAQAHARPIAGAHSIWELVLHLAGTYGLVLRRIEGDGRPLRPDEDWP